MCRMELVLKEKYGEAAYKASKQPDWVQLAKKNRGSKSLAKGSTSVASTCCGTPTILMDIK